MLVCPLGGEYRQWTVLYMGSQAGGPQEWWRAKARVGKDILDRMSLGIGEWEAPQ